MSDQPPVHVDVKQSRPSVRITLPAIYAEVRKQNEASARIEKKLDRGLDKLDRTRHQVADHEARLRVLESSMLSKRTVGAFIVAGAAVAGAIAAVAALVVQH